MPRNFHKQACFNAAEMERIKKVQGVKTDYRFFREAVMERVDRETVKPEPGSGVKSVGSKQEGNRSENDGNSASNEAGTDIW